MGGIGEQAVFQLVDDMGYGGARIGDAVGRVSQAIGFGHGFGAKKFNRQTNRFWSVLDTQYGLAFSPP
ncbi:hypothetical protein UNDKW_5370 [Undibacterium sp. KW1]|nr:hypothetical protein UNDKW_5370 [Undibacterium sp. KW1]